MTQPASHDRAAAFAFAAVAPHGELAIPEACAPEHASTALATQAGMAELARRFEAAQPDVVIVLTPHGLHVERHFAVVVAGRVAGALEEAPAVALDLATDRQLAAAVVGEMRRAGLPVVGASFGGNDPAEATMPLDWGSLIPLWYLGGRQRPPLPIVLVAPARELAPALHVEAGVSIARAASASGRRVAVIASADQAHTHAADGPYGFDPAARVFDELVAARVRDGRLGELADIDPALIAAAMPDSWWQLLMLAGAIGDAWRPELLSYEAPTYYGMLCAAFEPPR